MKKIFIIMLHALLATSMLAGCGTKAAETMSKQYATNKETENNQDEVYDFNGKWECYSTLTFGQEIIFDGNEGGTPAMLQLDINDDDVKVYMFGNEIENTHEYLGDIIEISIMGDPQKMILDGDFIRFRNKKCVTYNLKRVENFTPYDGY